MTARPTSDDPIVKQVHVPVEPDVAFDVFTARMTEWWPLTSHSVGLADAVAVTFPGARGGTIVERLADGTECVWGTVIDWDPPHRVEFTWHPGNPEAESTEVEVRFDRRGDGTLVELTHTGWQRRSDGGVARSRYESGWDLVLAPFSSWSGGVRH